MSATTYTYPDHHCGVCAHRACPAREPGPMDGSAPGSSPCLDYVPLPERFRVAARYFNDYRKAWTYARLLTATEPGPVVIYEDTGTEWVVNVMLQRRES